MVPKPHKTVFKRRLTKGKLAAAQRRDLYLAVAAWWRGKIQTRVIFEVADVFEKGVDYVGELPWPNEVSSRALHDDFVLSCPSAPPSSRFQFLRVFREVSGVASIGTRDTSPRRGNGTCLMYVSSAFYPLGKFGS